MNHAGLDADIVGDECFTNQLAQQLLKSRRVQERFGGGFLDGTLLPTAMANEPSGGAPALLTRADYGAVGPGVGVQKRLSHCFCMTNVWKFVFLTSFLCSQCGQVKVAKLKCRGH